MTELDEGVGAVYREAQEAVIGSLLIDPERTLGPVMDAVGPESFSGEYRTVFSAVRKLWTERQPVDPVTVLAGCGDAFEPMLRRCMAMTPTAVNAGKYAQVVRAQARLLALRDAGMALAGAVDEAEAVKILAGAESLLTQRTRVRVFELQALVGEFYQSMGKEKPRYLPWGIRALDDKLTCELGDLVILGADSSVGKTALALQFAWHMASRRYRVGFFSLETKSTKLCHRLVAQRARVSAEAIRRGEYEDGDYKAVLNMGRDAGILKLDIIEASGFTAEEIRAATVAGQYQVVFIDYLQLIRGEGKNRAEVVANLSMDIHTMAQDLGVTVVALSQITPADKKEESRVDPGKEDLRESRQLIHDADIILMMSLYDPDDNASMRWLNCRKNKEGELPYAALAFDADHMTFQSVIAARPAKKKKKAAGGETFLTAKQEPEPQGEQVSWTEVAENAKEDLPL